MVLFETVDPFLQKQAVYTELAVSPDRLRRYLERIEGTYGALPYHCLSHVVHVTRMAIDLWSTTELGDIVRKASSKDYHVLALALCTAAAVHDAGHLGFTNDFLVRSHHEYALSFNDSSPNESTHASTAFKILMQRDNNFLEGLSPDKFWLFRQTVIALVLGTDMAKHQAAVSKLRARDFSDVSSGDIQVILLAVMKCADLSHVFMPFPEHEVWSRRLQLELFREGDRWQELGWQPPSLMRRDSPDNFASSQLGFFQFLVIPFVEAFVVLLPSAGRLLEAARGNLEGWKEV